MTTFTAVGPDVSDEQAARLAGDLQKYLDEILQYPSFVNYTVAAGDPIPADVDDSAV